MTAKSYKKPSPAELLAEVREKEEAQTYAFEDYLQVVHELQRKGYSYAKIADFLAEKLSINVTRGQVYRAYQQWLEIQEENARQEAEERFLGRDDDEPPSPEDEREEEIQKALADVIGYAAEKYPQASSSFRLPELFGRIVCVFDQEAADERAASEADAKIDKSADAS